MASEIYEIDDEQSMAYVMETPWHGLGQKLDPYAPLEVWAEKAHLDWEYNEAIVRYNNVVQPMEVLEFYRDLIADHGFSMDTAGSLADGRKVWALANVGQNFEVDGDKINGYLLLATSCDRSLATTAQFTTVRVVCSNTLQLVTDDKGRGSGAKQHHSMKFDPRAMKIDLGLMEDQFGQFEQDVRRMKHTNLEDRHAMMAIIAVVSGKEMTPTYNEENVEKPRLVEAVYNAYKEAPGNEPTAWGLVNAFTYHSDHVRGRSTDTRLNSAWFGQAAKQKADAFKVAMRLAA